MTYEIRPFYQTNLFETVVKMLKLVVVSLFFVLIKAQGPYHHVIIQIFDNEDTLVPPIVSVGEGANVTLNCRTLHLIYHPGRNYYDEDIIWSRAQNWRLQTIRQKSIQNIQKRTKLVFEPIGLEDQGRYICTSLKYHTSRILYVLVQPKNQTEQYFRRKRDLTKISTEETSLDKQANETVLFDNNDLLPVLFLKGSFRGRPHLRFIMIALFLISLLLVFMFLVKLCNKCRMPEKSRCCNQEYAQFQLKVCYILAYTKTV